MNFYFFFFLIILTYTSAVKQLQNFLNEPEDEAKMSILSKYLSVKYKFWGQGIKGRKVKVGIFDSGLSLNNTRCNITKIENFSNEQGGDFNGHGSYITSIICDEKLGIVPEAEMFIYKVFDSNRKTRTSWIINALDQAREDKVDIVNLSFGGINFDETLIIDKLEELVSLGIVIVASAGNDGPSFGSINFPGSLPFVITVGSLSKEIFNILDISSRGPAIYKKNVLIPKPNTWAPGESIEGFNHFGNSTLKNGSSVSSALVTGYLSLLISHHYDQRSFFNAGSLMLLIRDSNMNNPNINKGELIGGVFNLDGLFKITKYYIEHKQEMTPQILNNVNDFSLDHFSNYTISNENKVIQKTSLYATVQPLFFTLIFVNPINPEINKINYEYEIQKIEENHNCVDLSAVRKNSTKSFFFYTDHVGVMQMKLQINNDGKCHFLRERIDWNILFTDELTKSKIGLKLIFDIIPTPSRYSRILISRYHNLYYPFDGFIPKDNLYDNWYNFDWTYESIDTNYYGLYKHLKEFDFYLEESNESLDCVDLTLYSVLLMIDTEKSLTSSEIERLKWEYEDNHLSIFIISDWSDPLIKKKFEFIDEDSNKIISPINRGAEIFSLNDFLEGYGIKIGEDSISRDFYINNKILKIKSGSSIAKFPSNSYLFGNFLKNDLTLIDTKYESKVYRAILGFVVQLTGKNNSGRLALFTDSFCFDDYQLKFSQENSCFWMIASIIKFLAHGKYVISDLQLKNKELLNYDYDDELLRQVYYNNTFENETQILPKGICSGNNFTNILKENKLVEFIPYVHHYTQIKTDVIPNLISRNSFENEKVEKKENLNEFIDFLEDLLYVAVPIVAVLFIIFLIIHCRQTRVKRIRMNVNLSQLKQTTAIEYENLNESTDSSSRIINSIV